MSWMTIRDDYGVVHIDTLKVEYIKEGDGEIQLQINGVTTKLLYRSNRDYEHVVKKIREEICH